MTHQAILLMEHKIDSEICENESDKINNTEFVNKNGKKQLMVRWREMKWTQ